MEGTYTEEREAELNVNAMRDLAAKEPEIIDAKLKRMQLDGAVVDMRNRTEDEIHELLNKHPWVPVTEIYWACYILEIWRIQLFASLNKFAQELHGEYKPRIDMKPLIYSLINQLVRSDDAGAEMATCATSHGTIYSHSLVSLYGPVSPYEMNIPLKMAYLLQGEKMQMHYSTVSLILPSKRRDFEILTRRVPPAGSRRIVDLDYMEDMKHRLDLCCEFLDYTDIYTNSANIILLIGCIGSKHPKVLGEVLIAFHSGAVKQCPKRQYPGDFFTPTVAHMLILSRRVLDLWPLVCDKIPAPWYDDGSDFTRYTLAVEEVEAEHNKKGCQDADSCPFVHGCETNVDVEFTHVGPILNRQSRLTTLIFATNQSHIIYERELFVTPDDEEEYPMIEQDTDLSELF
jgi:hypothetical protein